MVQERRPVRAAKGRDWTREVSDCVKDVVIVPEKMERHGKVSCCWGKGGVASDSQFEKFMV